MFGSIDNLILNPDEFLFWKIAVYAAFEGDDLGSHLESSAPPHEATPKERRDWIKRDRLGFGYLFRTLSSRDKYVVQNCRTCFDLFTTLQSKYEMADSAPASMIHQLVVMPHPTASVDKIVLDMANLKTKFDQSDDRISDATFIQLTVEKLPESMKKFKDSCLNNSLKFSNFNEFALCAISKVKEDGEETEPKKETPRETLREILKENDAQKEQAKKKEVTEGKKEKADKKLNGKAAIKKQH